MNNCAFEQMEDSRWKCSACGLVLLRKSIIACKALRGNKPPKRPSAKKPRVKCPHLGNVIGESVATVNCGCGNSTSLYECEKFWKDCAPHVRSKLGEVANNKAGEVVLLCRDCEHNPANQQSPSSPSTR